MYNIYMGQLAEQRQLEASMVAPLPGPPTVSSDSAPSTTSAPLINPNAGLLANYWQLLRATTASFVGGLYETPQEALLTHWSPWHEPVLAATLAFAFVSLLPRVLAPMRASTIGMGWRLLAALRELLLLVVVLAVLFIARDGFGSLVLCQLMVTEIAASFHAAEFAFRNLGFRHHDMYRIVRRLDAAFTFVFRFFLNALLLLRLGRVLAGPPQLAPLLGNQLHLVILVGEALVALLNMSVYYQRGTRLRFVQRLKRWWAARFADPNSRPTAASGGVCDAHGHSHSHPHTEDMPLVATAAPGMGSTFYRGRGKTRKLRTRRDLDRIVAKKAAKNSDDDDEEEVPAAARSGNGGAASHMHGHSRTRSKPLLHSAHMRARTAAGLDDAIV